MKLKLSSVVVLMIALSCLLVSCGDNSSNVKGSTVTAEEWDQLFSYDNYTVSSTVTYPYGPNGENNYTVDSIYKIDGTNQSIVQTHNGEILMEYHFTLINGHFYEIHKEDGEYVAYMQDGAYRNYFDPYGLEGMYDQFEYDKKTGAYVLRMYGKEMCKIYIKDNKIVKFMENVSTGEFYTSIISSYGTTEVTLPEFTIKEYTYD